MLMVTWLACALALQSFMGQDTNIVRLLDQAPHVTCPRCSVDMTVRALDRVADTQEYTAAYRCPKCGTDTQREFSDPNPA